MSTLLTEETFDDACISERTIASGAVENIHLESSAFISPAFLCSTIQNEVADFQITLPTVLASGEVISSGEIVFYESGSLGRYNTEGGDVITASDSAFVVGIARETVYGSGEGLSGECIISSFSHAILLESMPQYNSGEFYYCSEHGTPVPYTVDIESGQSLFLGRSEDAVFDGAAYFYGGDRNISDEEINKLHFATETISLVSGGTATLRANGTGVSSICKGYCVGGSLRFPENDLFTATVDDIDFQSESASLLSVTLDTGRRNPAGIGNTSNGSICGGIDENYDYLDSVEDLDYESESFTIISNTLSAIKSGMAGVSSYSKGYCSGGDNPGGTDAIEGLRFFDKTIALISSTLPQARSYHAGFNSSARGYMAGGEDGMSYDDIYSLEFYTEVTSTESETLAAIKRGVTGSFSSVCGYIAGGFDTTDPLYTYYNTIEVMQFSTSTKSISSETLSTATESQQACQTNGLANLRLSPFWFDI